MAFFRSLLGHAASRVLTDNPVRAGLTVDWDPRAGVTADAAGLVSRIADQSGNGNAATNTDAPSARPQWVDGVVNGLPVLRFDGADFLGASASGGAAMANLPGLDDWTLVAVCRPADGFGARTTECVIGAGLDSHAHIAALANAPGKLGVLYGGVAWHTSQRDLAEGWQLLVAVRAAGTLRLYVNNADVGETWSTAPSGGGVLMLGAAAPGVHGFAGDIARGMIYTAALSATDRTTLAAYLGTLYGIALAGS